MANGWVFDEVIFAANFENKSWSKESQRLWCDCQSVFTFVDEVGGGLEWFTGAHTNNKNVVEFLPGFASFSKLVLSTW
jgi:hypothetical protein